MLTAARRAIRSRARRMMAGAAQRVGTWLLRERPVSGSPWGMFGRWGKVFGEWCVGAWQRNQALACEDITAFSAVYACITIVAQDIAKLGGPILWQEQGAGGRTRFTASPYSRLLRKPNPWQTAVEFYMAWIVSILLTGNAYVLLFRDGRNAVYRMEVLDPRRVRVYLTDEGEAFYRCAEDPLHGLYADIDIPARDMIHDRINTLFHPLVGTSPITAAASSAVAGLRILQQAEEFFGNMSAPSGVLVTDQRITDADHTAILQRWNARYSGAENAGKTALLGMGIKFEPLKISAVDAQLIEQLKFSVEDVARCFRVPAFQLGDLTRATFKNVEQLNRIYYSGCLQYHFERMEWAIDAGLELAPDVSAEFDLDALFRMESDVRFATYKLALDSGILSINEVRAKEGLGPVKGGEKPRLQQQYRPIDEAPPPAPANDPGVAAPEPAPAEDEEPDELDDPEEEARAVALEIRERIAAYG